MDKQTHEKVSITKSSDSNITIQTFSGSKTQMGNIMKKSRWDQPPSDEDNSKDTSKMSGSNTKLISEVRGHSSSTNVESGNSKGSVKEFVSKFEIISGSAKRNPTLIKCHVSGPDQGTGNEENNINRNLGGTVKEREEHLHHGHAEQDNADSGTEQSLSKTSRVKLVRTNFNATVQQASDSVRSVKCEGEKRSLLYSDNRDNDAKYGMEAVYIGETRDLSLKEERKDVKMGQKQDKDNYVDRDLPSAEGVITSTALQMISSYDDSPSEDSLSETENISANNPSFPDTEKLSDTVVDELKKNGRTASKKSNQIKRKEINVNDASKEASTVVEHVGIDSKLHKVSNIVKDTKEESSTREEENYKFMTETSLKGQVYDSQPGLSCDSEVEVSVESFKIHSEEKLSNLFENSGPCISRSDTDSLSYSESKASEFATKDGQNSELKIILSETDKLTINICELKNKDGSFKNENASKTTLSGSESVKEVELELVEKVNSANKSKELNNVGNKDIAVTTSKDDVNNYLHELEDIQVEMQNKSDEGNITVRSPEDSNKASNNSENIPTEHAEKEINSADNLNRKCEQAENDIDNMSKYSCCEGEETAYTDVEVEKLNLQELETSSETAYTKLLKNQGQKVENNKREVNSKRFKTCDSPENMTKDIDILNNTQVEKEYAENTSMERMCLSDEAGKLNKVNEVIEEENLKTSDESIGNEKQESGCTGESFSGELQDTDIIKDVEESSITGKLQNQCDIQTGTESKLSDDMQKFSNLCGETYKSENISTGNVDSNYDLCNKDTCTVVGNTAIQKPECSDARENLSISGTTESNENKIKDDIEICESKDYKGLFVPLTTQEENVQEGTASDIDCRKYEQSEKTGIINKQINPELDVDLMDACEDNAVDGSSVLESDKNKSEESHLEITDNLVCENESIEYNSSPHLGGDINMDISSIPLPNVCEDSSTNSTATAILVSGNVVNEVNLIVATLNEKSTTQEENQASEVCKDNRSQSFCAENKLNKDDVKSESSVFSVDNSKCFKEEGDVFCDSGQGAMPQTTNKVNSIEDKSAEEIDGSNKTLSNSDVYCSLNTVSDIEVDNKDVDRLVIINNDSGKCLNEIDLTIEGKAMEKAVEHNKIDEILPAKLKSVYSKRNTEVSACSEEIISVSAVQSEENDTQKLNLDSKDTSEEKLLEHINERVCSVTDNIENKTIENSEVSEEQSLNDIENILCDNEKCETAKISDELISVSKRSHNDQPKVENNLLLHQEYSNTKSLSIEEVDDNTVEEKKAHTQDKPEKQLGEFERIDSKTSCETIRISNSEGIIQGVCETGRDQDCLKIDLIVTNSSALVSGDEVEKMFDVSSEFINTDNNRTPKEVGDILKVEENTKAIEDTIRNVGDAVTENIKNNNDSKAEEIMEFRHKNVSVVAGTSDPIECKFMTHSGKTNEHSVKNDNDKLKEASSFKESKILSKDSILANSLENERSKNNSTLSAVESHGKELSIHSHDNLSINTGHTLAEAENICQKNKIVTEKVLDKKTDEKQKCKIEINITENVENKFNSILEPTNSADIFEEDAGSKVQDINLIKEQNEKEESDIKTTKHEKLLANQDECNVKSSTLLADKTLIVDLAEDLDNSIKEREVSNPNIPENVQTVMRDARNIKNSESNKLDAKIKEVESNEEGVSDIYKMQHENGSSLMESSNENLIKSNATREIFDQSSTSETKEEYKALAETTTLSAAHLNDKISHSAENDEHFVTSDKVKKNVAQLPLEGSVVIHNSNIETEIACKNVSLKRLQSPSGEEDIFSDTVSEHADSKLLVSASKKQKLSESIQSGKECLSKSMKSNPEILFSSMHGSEGLINEETTNKEKVQSVMKEAVSANKHSKGNTLESPLDSKIYKALSDRKEVCITKVAQIHKPHRQEDILGSSQTTDSSSSVTSCSRSHLFTKDGKLFTSQDDVVKELPQVKLEPITLKLSRDSTLVTRAASVSPKKTSNVDTNVGVVRAESVSPKKTCDYVKNNDSPKSQLSPKTKTLGYTLKIGKDSSTIVPKESKLSPRIKEHSSGTSSSSCLKNSDLSKVEHMLKETGVTITPVSSTETQESQKLSKITLKLSKAGGHPEIKQEKTETWKTVQKLTEVDIVPLQDSERIQSVVQQFKRKDNVEAHIPEKKLKLGTGKEFNVSSGLNLPEQNKLQGLLAKTHVFSCDSPRSSSSDDVQIVGVIPPKDPLLIQGDNTSLGSAGVTKILESATVKQEVVEIRPQPKKRGRPRKVVVPVIPLPVHVKDESDPSGPMFPTPLFNLTDDAFGEGNATGPPTLFPDQVQPGRRPKRACSGRIKLPVVRSRRPRGSGIVRGVTRGRGRGRGVKRKYDGTEFLSNSLSPNNIENQIGPNGSGEGGTEGNEHNIILPSPILKNESEDCNTGRTEIQKEVKIKTQKLKKETRRHKREGKRAKKKSGSGSIPIVLPPPQMFEEETRMSATESNSRSQTPARAAGVDGMGEESQGSLISTPGEQSSTIKENNRNKKGRMEVIDLESSKEFTVDQITEYQWPLQGGELWMIQEQISLYLGVKSFKRKYPDIKRRPVEPEERQYLCDNGLVSESMCDLGLTSVSSAEILDIMFQDFQDKYEDFRKHIREKQARELSNKQKASEKKKSEQGPQKLDIKEQAIQSASSWNQSFNKSRLDHRRCALDLQTWTIQFPRNRLQKMTRPIPKLSAYPVAVIPGQFCDYYKSYTPQELRYFPLNTVLYGPMKPNERHHIGGSDGSQSESEESSSSDDSSDSSSDGEATCEEEEKEVKDVLVPVKSEQLKMQSYPPSVNVSDKSVM